MARPKKIEDITIPGCGAYQRITHADGTTSLVARVPENDPKKAVKHPRRTRGINWKSRI